MAPIANNHPHGKRFARLQITKSGLAQYIETERSSFDKALEIAQQAAANLPLTNFAICSAISHVQNMSSFDAAYAESVVAGVVNTQPAARERLAAFADKSAPRTRPNAE